jgi:GT2 family glycosyltransferase
VTVQTTLGSAVANAQRFWSTLSPRELVARARGLGYREWIDHFEPKRPSTSLRQRSFPSIGLVVLGNRTSTVERDVAAQWIPPLEVIVASDAASVAQAVAAARSDAIAVLGAEARLAPNAIAEIATAFAGGADLVLSDEDRLDGDGRRSDPWFLPEDDPDLLLSRDVGARLVALRTDLARHAGGLRPVFERCAGYDLLLRSWELSRARMRIPRVLVHSTDQPPGALAADALAERWPRACVLPGFLPGSFRVEHPLASARPRVSVIVPTRDRPDLLRRCIDGLQANPYGPLEILVVDNGSVREETHALLRAIEARRAARVLRDARPFNYSALNNHAAGIATGEILCFLNDDVVPPPTGWLRELVSQSSRPGVGAVGARLTYPGGSVQHAGIVTGLYGTAAHIFRGASASSPGDALGRAWIVRGCSAATGACLAVPADTFRAVGGFDERLAVAFNDVDLCLRIRELGKRVVFTPFAELVHEEQQSRGHDDTLARRMRLLRETDLLHARWGQRLREDPFYSPNLSLRSQNAGLAWPPRTRVRA